MIAMDLTHATPDDKASCFGEAFRDVQMLNFKTSHGGVMLTRIMLDGHPVTLVGDPEEALARLQHKSTAWAIRRLIEAAAHGIRKAWAAIAWQKNHETRKKRHFLLPPRARARFVGIVPVSRRSGPALCGRSFRSFQCSFNERSPSPRQQTHSRTTRTQSGGSFWASRSTAPSASQPSCTEAPAHIGHPLAMKGIAT